MPPPAEPARVSDGVVVADLGVVSVDRAREVAGPEVLEPAAGRPRRGLLDLTAVGEGTVGDEAERNGVAAAERAPGLTRLLPPP